MNATTDTTIKAIGKTAFPEYKGRKFRLSETRQVGFYGLNWDGGSRSTYRIVRLSDMKVVSLDALSRVAPWENRAEGCVVPMRKGYAVVEHSIFCGKDCGLVVNMPAPDCLPEPSDGLLALACQ